MTAAAAATVTTHHNSGTTMNTTTGVMHNLPVLWLVVGLVVSLFHAPVPIVGQLKVALLLCVVHAVQCAVSVPGLWSRQQWQLVWAGPRVLLCSRGGNWPSRWVWPAMAQRLRPTIRSWLLSLSLCIALTTPLKVSPSNSNGLRKRWWKWWEHDNPEPNHSGFGSAFVQWTDLLQINKSACRNVLFLIL